MRPAAREQILSVGAKPVELDLDTGEAEGSGKNAKKNANDVQQRKHVGEVVGASERAAHSRQNAAIQSFGPTSARSYTSLHAA